MIGEAFQLTHKGLNNIFAGKNTTLTFAQIEEKANVVPFEQVFRLYAQKECKNEFDKCDTSGLARLFNDGGLEYDNCRNKLSLSKQFEMKGHLGKLLDHKKRIHEREHHLGAIHCRVGERRTTNDASNSKSASGEARCCGSRIRIRRNT